MKNNRLTACIFPDTVPGDAILFPLVQIFHPLVYCQAVEEDEIPCDLASSVRNQLEEAGLCRIHVPAPLGEHRQRFLALIKDLATQKDDYAVRLKNLALSGIGLDARSKRESKSSIIDNLLQGQRIVDQAGEKRKMLLWQARLVLKLGEIFDGEQGTLHREMERIAQKEEGLFSELRREQADPFSFTQNMQTGMGSNDGLLQLRLKAWTRLFCLGTRKLEEFSCFVTTNQDALDLLVEKYERDEENHARPLPVILLPTGCNQDTWQKELQDFQDQGMDLLADLAEILRGDTLPGDEDTFSSGDGTWAQLLDTIYPRSLHGRCRLHLYRFGAAESCELFMETFGREDEQARGLKKSAKGLLVGRLELSEN